MIYLDNAATSLLKPPSVKQAVYDSFEYVGNPFRGSHEASMIAIKKVAETRQNLATLFGCNPAEVAFTKNATESLNIAIHGLLEENDHVITTPFEHNSVIRPLHLCETIKNVSISTLPGNKDGTIDYNKLEKYLLPTTKALIATHASNVTGIVTDIEILGQFCKEHGLIFVVDASQTAGAYPIDMEKANIDILCFTGHKGLMGPQGTGGICVKEPIHLHPFIVGGTGIDTYNKNQPTEMPFYLEAGTLNVHGLIGLHAATTYILDVGIENIQAKEKALHDLFVSLLKDASSIEFLGDLSVEKVGIISLNIKNQDSSLVSSLLMEKEIATRAGAHCAPSTHETLGTTEQGAIRFSFSHLNTEEEVRNAALTLLAIAETLTTDT